MANANVGMMYPVFAKLNSHTDGSMPTYGTGTVIHEARNATVTKTYADNPLYGDDRIVDDDNGMTALNVSFEPTGVSDSDRVLLFGEVLKGNIGGITAQVEMDNETPWGGFAYVRKMRDKGVYSYEAWVILKIKFSEENQTTTTKEGSIVWNTPTLNGRAAALDIDGSGKLAWRVHQSFETLSAAKAWINTMLNVSTATT